MCLLFPYNFSCAQSVTSGLISAPLTLLSSGPPDQRKQIRRWQSCHGNGSSWWHPASPPQWWKWYSLAHSGQAVAGIPYIKKRGRRVEKKKEREREWVKVVTQLPPWATSHPPLSATSPSLHLSSSPFLSPLLISVSRELPPEGSRVERMSGWGGMGHFMTVEKTGWRLEWWMLALQLVRRDSVHRTDVSFGLKWKLWENLPFLVTGRCQGVGQTCKQAMTQKKTQCEIKSLCWFRFSNLQRWFVSELEWLDSVWFLWSHQIHFSLSKLGVNIS